MTHVHRGTEIRFHFGDAVSEGSFGETQKAVKKPKHEVMQDTLLFVNTYHINEFKTLILTNSKVHWIDISIPQISRTPFVA